MLSGRRSDSHDQAPLNTSWWARLDRLVDGRPRPRAVPINGLARFAFRSLIAAAVREVCQPPGSRTPLGDQPLQFQSLRSCQPYAVLLDVGRF
jgi:hypothetical protein